VTGGPGAGTGRPDGPWPVAATRGLAVLGWPVAHSLSPVMHNAALAADGRDAVYLALPVPSGELAGVVRALGATGFVGANVTVPHKQAVVNVCDTLSDEARLVGAVNTLTWRDDGLEGHNTDALGLQRALDEVGAGSGPAVVLGTGGAARAAVVALVRRGASVTVVGRRPDAAVALGGLGRRVADEPESTGRAVGLGLDDPTVAERVGGAEVVVNATPLGMRGEPLPGAFMRLAPDQLAYDLVYAPPDTPFLRAAAENGAPAHHGLSMLVHQAAAAYEHWFGGPAPLPSMRRAAEDALVARGNLG
jgi:shikimate dehydrogenase